MRARDLFQAGARRARERLTEGDEPVWERLAGPLASGLSDLVGILRAMVEIPARLFLRTAEVAGAAVLAVWRTILPVIRAARSGAATTLRVAEREITPARGLAAIAAVALVTVAVTEFADYRAVSIGAPDYSGKELVAPAPRVDERTAGSAHSNLLLPLALVGGVILALSVRGRWQLARLLSVIGVIVIAVSLLNDLPKGLDEGGTALEYEGAEANLLGPFWAQLGAGAVLACCGLLLAPRLRDQGRRVGERTPSPRRRRGPTGIVTGDGGAGAPGAGA
jgi:hypothetical protein